ncbi:MAG: hypothetical protein ACF8R7_06300 [Phycisphaerales bacterium JB039]
MCGQARRTAAILLLLTLPALVAACASPPRKRLIDAVPSARLSEPELGARVAEVRLKFSASIEHAGAQVILNTSDSLLRERALLMMIRVNEEIIRTGSHPDPVVQFVDLWVLVAQLNEFFDAGAGVDYFGPQQAIVQASVADMRSAMEALADEFLGDDRDRRGELLVADWVEQNPINLQRLSRTSVRPLMASYLGDKVKGDLFSSVNSLDESVSNISDRLEIMTTQLPKQMIWYADLLITDRIDQLRADPAFAAIEQTMTDLPGEVDRQRTDSFDRIDFQRAETLEAIDQQRADTLAAIDQQRTDTLAAIDLQRTDTLDRIDALRQGLTADLDRQTSIALESVNAQRINTLDRMDESLAGATEALDATIAQLAIQREAAFRDAEALLDRRIDRIFVRSVQLLIIAAVLGSLLLGLAWLVRVRR